ncbi:protein lin-54 homolog isoform X1 [Drosophila sulfurigaster albostrigata]|uniref:protein lin-54 homolog isoform X1 n=1 Tax=Drosophila sulfurigaster albostrigata TaxID=89887 RepID=UPI002D21E3DC|nr:protein lin-54 homolog isoform X1 [Drosophila sulfurigaster albostrigata]
MFAYRVSGAQDELDDTTPLPELTFYDLLEPSTTSKEQHLSQADNDIAQDDDDVDEDDADECEEEFLSTSLNESLNTPKIKKPSIVRILENKRLTAPAPIGTALKTMLGGPIRIVSTPTKSTTQGTEVKILNKLQQPVKSFANVPVKIGSTTIATPAAGATKNLSGVTMTPIKMADGKLLFLQKSIATPGGAAAKLPISGASTRLIAQSSAAGGGIRQTVLPKGVTITSSGLIKSSASIAPIAVKGLTTIGSSKPTTLINTSVQSSPAVTNSTAAAPSTTATAATTIQMSSKMPIKVVRTADGKLIKLNQGAAPTMLLNAKAAAVSVKPSGSTATATATAIASTSSSNTSSNKPVTTQVIIKGPLKQISAGSSLRPVINNVPSSSATAVNNSSTGSSPTTAATSATLPTGKMLVQSLTGKQIVVASKNIIKLSPKPAASGSANANASSSVSPSGTGNTASTGTTPTGLHAIQLPGKSGVQYVRVLPNSGGASKVSTSPQRVPLGRPSSTPTVSLGSTNKIVMKTMGGSIVPLPSMQTLVPRRVPGTPVSAVHGKAPGKGVSNNANLEGARKHRLSDLNVQIKHLINDSNETAGPDAKKARYVISMPQISASATATTTTTPATQQQMQKLAATRPTTVQRVAVQGGNSSSSSNSGETRKVYNLVTKSDANGVKYMICNKSGEGGKPRTLFNTTMRRGYTLADSKLRRPTTLSPQQIRFKQMKLQQQRQVLAQAQAKLRQQQQHKQQQSPQATKPQQQQQKSQSTTAQANKSSVPGKPMFDILKPPPPPTPAPAATTVIEALGGSRRKHCNCSKSQCLKLYCDCFANGEFCQDCTCKDCFNNLDYEVKRERAIRSCLERNPSAFKPKITAPNSGDMRLHNKGCNCKRSGCLKNYCECYEAKIPCSAMCKCVGCRNMEDRPDVDMDSMDSLADVKSRPNKMKDLNGAHAHDNRSNAYLTDDVIEATIMCMISRIVMHEKQNLPIEDTEREVMEELGESLNQIITFAKEKNDTIQMDDPKTTA